MQVYRVYRHRTKGYKAVPTGFSFSAFVTSFIWAAANSLWGKAFLLFLGFISMIVAVGAGVHLNFPMLSLSGVAGLAILPLWSGMQGQQWICGSLESQGYNLVLRIRSLDAAAAIKLAKRNEDKEQSSKTDSAKPKQQTGFGRDFRDIRDNSEANSNQPPPIEFRASPWKRR